MAWLFQLAIECGNDQAAAIRVKDHFDGVMLGTDQRPRLCHVGQLDQDELGRWWVSVVPDGAEPIAARGDKDLVREVSIDLYERLRTASGYRFALAGVEAFQFNDLEALPSIIGNPALNGFVVQEELFRSILGNPGGFVPFSEGYVWKPL